MNFLDNEYDISWLSSFLWDNKYNAIKSPGKAVYVAREVMDIMPFRY